MSSSILHLLRWSARIAALLLVAMVGLIALGHGGLPNVLGQPVPVQVEFVALGLMVVGLVAGWKWEAWGGAVTLIGVGLFAATELAVNHRLPGGAIPWFLIPAVLFLLAFTLERAGHRRHDGVVPKVH
jgi:hypothetical protein